jgi:methylase of polypeptide subunit release factors
MMLPPENLKLKPPDSHQAERIRRTLESAGYTESRVLQLLKISEWRGARERLSALPLYLERTRASDSLNTLVRLFLLRQTVTLDSARRAVSPMEIEDWAEVGLVHLKGDEVAASVELSLYDGLVIAADWSERAEPDQVMNVAASSRALAEMTIRRTVARTLDLGTGCGVQALLAARHSEEVCGVDSNPRAIRFAEFNARLNGVSNITWRAGNLFEPIDGETFDLIVCNPPFVVAPVADYLHTSTSLPHDEFCRNLVRAAPKFLSEGGYCQLLCNWCQMEGEDWRARLATWFEGSGCDAWAMHAHTEEASLYAFNRIGERVQDKALAARKFNEWVNYYRRERIEAIGFGLLTMRRRDGRENWFRCDSLPEVRGACGEEIARGFAVRDFLEATRDDEQLLSARLRRSDKIEWQQRLTLSTEGWSIKESRLSLAEGLSYVAQADEDVIEFLSQCDGRFELRDYLRELSAVKRQAIENLAADFLRVVRRLIELGFLSPADTTSMTKR